jgi:hypothetical protein
MMTMKVELRTKIRGGERERELMKQEKRVSTLVGA